MTRSVLTLRVAVLVLAALAVFSLAASGKAVMLQPKPGEKLTGQKAEIAVGFDFGSDAVSYAEFYVNGKLYATKNVQQPQARGVCSFLCDTTRLKNASHTFLVKLFAGDRLLGNASGTAVVANKPTDSSSPNVAFSGLKSGQVLKGKCEVRLAVTDNADNAPMVTVKIDNELKLLSNRPPYSFTWDTTEVPDGVHVIEASATDESGNIGQTTVTRVIVANNSSPEMMSAKADSGNSGQVPAKAVIAPKSASDRAVETAPIAPAKVNALKTETSRAAPPQLPESPFLSGMSYTPKSKPAKETEVTTVAALPKNEMNLPPPQTELKAPPGNPELSLPIFTEKSLMRNNASSEMMASGERSELKVEEPISLNEPELPPAEPPKPVKTAMLPAELPAKIEWSARELSIAPYAPKGTGKKKSIASHRKPAPLSVVVNGCKIHGDVRPRIMSNGIGVVPIRQVVEAAGGQVIWHKQQKMISIITTDARLTVTVGENVAMVNRKKMRMPLPVTIEADRAMMPISFLAETLGMEVYHDAVLSRFVLAKKKTEVYG